MHLLLEDVQMERAVSCPRGHQVKLVDQGNGVQNLNAEFDKFSREMRRLSGTVKIKP